MTVAVHGWISPRSSYLTSEFVTGPVKLPVTEDDKKLVQIHGKVFNEKKGWNYSLYVPVEKWVKGQLKGTKYVFYNMLADN